MGNTFNSDLIKERKPWLSFLVAILFLVGSAGFFGTAFMYLYIWLFTSIDARQVEEITSNALEYPEHKSTLLILQGILLFAIFGLSAILYKFFYDREAFHFLRFPKKLVLPAALLVSVITFCSILVNEFFIGLNKNLSLPEFASGLEQWAREKEDTANELIEFLTVFDSNQYFLLAVIVIAIIPAVSEELFFRGVLQNILVKISKNPHLAVWLTAIIFSAIHMQFYGFLPRMLLGVIFGYFYIWTGSLVFPMIAHFINNMFSLYLMFLYQGDLTDIDVNSAEHFPWYITVLFALLTVILLYYFKKNFSQPVPNESGVAKNI